MNQFTPDPISTTTARPGARSVPAGALRAFTVMAFVVGVGLLILCAEMVLHYGFDNDALAWWSPIHGLLYMIYVGATANLGFKAGWSLGKMVLIMLAGCVPLLSFLVERRVAAEMRGRVTGAAH